MRNPTLGQLRATMVILLVAGCAMSMVLVIWAFATQALHQDNLGAAFIDVLVVYTPFLAAIVGVLASGHLAVKGEMSSDHRRLPVYAVLIGVPVVLLWSFVPPVLILAGVDINLLGETLRGWDLFGETVALGAVAYYFAHD